MQRLLLVLTLVLSGCASAESLSRDATPSGTSTFDAPYDDVYRMILQTASEGGLLTVSEDRAAGDIRLRSGSYFGARAQCEGNLLGLFLTREGQRTRVQIQERLVLATQAFGGLACQDLAPIFMSRLSARIGGQLGANQGGMRGQSGTGYFITSAGHMITNAHVIEGCSRDITLSGPSWLPQNSRVRTINADEANDLAVLQLVDGRATNHVKLRLSPPQLGEPVAVLGYPLQPILASELNATTGTVSSLAGYQNDRRHLQISAPTQQGNSGGPVVDQSGVVIGTVVSGLVTGPGFFPQNVNFAINNVILRAFLQLNQIEPELTADTSRKDVTQLAAEARNYVVSIRCVAE
jgi:S1-C subfamily serine protease